MPSLRVKAVLKGILKDSCRYRMGLLSGVTGVNGVGANEMQFNERREVRSVQEEGRKR
jgi:hypothetical protein